MLKTSTTLDLSRADILARLDGATKERLRIPAREFVRLYRAGKLEDLGSFADLISLIYLLPEDDPLFADAA